MTITITTSVVPAVLNALQTQLRARGGLVGVQISQGYPISPEDEVISIIDVEPHEQRPAGQRAVPHKREEQFTIMIQASVIRTGDEDARQAVERAYELAAEFEDALRNDMEISASLGNGWAEVVGLPLSIMGPAGEGRYEAVIRGRIQCRVRI